jgi:transcriptional regulator with AAA-type ATPase domain
MTKRLLVSWIAWYNDFDMEAGEVSDQSPTYNLYASGFIEPYDQHLLLSTGEEGDDRSVLLYTSIKRNFAALGKKIEIEYPGVIDILDHQEIKVTVERVMKPYRDWQIDILFSAGTTVMRMVWVLFHLEKNGFRTQLIQGVDQKMSGENKPSFRPINLRDSVVAGRLDAVEASREEAPSDQFIPPFLQPIYAEASEAARAQAIPILIQGPSGSGKELLARHIHRQSARHERKMIPVNCAALGPDLLEARLFGFRKGSFTGATDSRAGYFEDAEGGILFLDEIGDISPYMQQSLLRVLQEGTITRVGETKDRHVNVRIIAATNKDLVQACEAGTFRWDLYYRLAVVELHLPPLRDYPQADRYDFIQYFLTQRQNLSKAGVPLTLDPEVEAWLLSQEFPGNLRELDTLITRLYVFTEGRARMSDLHHIMRHRQDPYDLSLAASEQRHIKQVLEAHGHNLSQTARALGIALNTLKNKLDKYELPRQEQKEA